MTRFRRRAAVCLACALWPFAASSCADLSPDTAGTLDGQTESSSDSIVSGGDAVQGDGVVGAAQRVRVVAANLSSGKKQSYDPGHGLRILQGLKPDIVLIQEFNVGNNGTADITEFVAATFGAGFSYYREPSGATMIPNGVISRFPILGAGSWDDSLSTNREFAWARLDVPGEKDLWAVSLHLLTSKNSVRAQQIEQLVGYLKDNVPSGDLLIVGGDLNTNSVSEKSLKGFDGVLVRNKQPVDQSGNGGTNAPRNKPYDRLFANAALDSVRIAVKIGTQSFTDGLVFDSRVYTPLADVAPVLKTDSGAESMQHMAVVRDFGLPVP